MEENEQTEVYLNKIDLGGALVNKELDLIHQHTKLINEIKRGYIDIDRVGEYDSYRFTWANVIELYTVLRDTYRKALTIVELKQLDTLINNYMDLTAKEPNLKELTFAYNLVLKIMSKTGFHQLIRNADMVKGLDKVNKRYKFKMVKNE